MTLQRGRHFLFASVFLAATFFIFHKVQSAPAKPKTESLYNQALDFPGRVSSATEINTAAATTSTTLPSNCSQFFETVETLPLSSLLSDLQDQRLKIPESCTQDKATDTLFQATLAACSPERIQDPKSDCEGKLFQYRARRLQLWSENQDLESLPTELLIQRFFGILSSGEMTEAGGSLKIRKIAQELKKRQPQSTAADRLEVLSYLMESNLSSEQSQAYDDALARARAQNPQDWQLFEIELLKHSQEDPELYQQQVQELLAQNPSSPIGLYHAGCLAWSRDNRQAALSYFETALHNNPDEARMRETLEKAQTETLGASICSASLSFQLDQF